MPDAKIPFDRPVISIDRAAHTYAVFNDFNLVLPFKPYDNEETAIAHAKAWIAEHTNLVPDVVYPRIDSLVIKSGRIRRRR